MTQNSDAAGCECATLRAPGPFHGWADFDAFAVSLREGTLFAEVPVEKPHSNVGLVEKWFKCAKCNSLWRLVEPDPPFAGVWERVP